MEIRSYGRRRMHRFSATKQQDLENLLDRYGIDISENSVEHPLHLREIFPRYSTLILEIGFGTGEHLFSMADQHRDIGFVGCEVFQNGIVRMLRNIDQNKLDNVRVYQDDVRQLLHVLEADVLHKIYVLFPDPWPKKRHASRRFVNPENLKEIARILQKGGLFRIATDHPVYKSWTLRRMTEDHNFRWTAKTGNDWRRQPADWVETKYQRKAVAEGRRPIFLDFERL